jgi:transposase
MLIYSRVNCAFSPIYALSRTNLRNFKTVSKLAKLEQVGLDEISLKKGHKDFVTIVSARIAGHIELLAVLKDCQKATVKKFLQGLPDRLKKTVKSVCCDLYDGFSNTAKEVFGKRTTNKVRLCE